MATYQIEFYEDENGDQPVRRWITEKLTRTQRFTLGQAMRQQLQEKGIGVCATAFGKQLGKGLFEFRLRREAFGTAPPGQHAAERARILLRVFCHAYGDRIVLLLGGYDKAPTPRRGGRTKRSPSRAVGSPTGGEARTEPGALDP